MTKREQQEKLFRAIGYVGDDLISRADQPVEKQRSNVYWIKWAALAACCVLVIGLASRLPLWSMKSANTAETATMTMETAAAEEAPAAAEPEETMEEAAAEETADWLERLGVINDEEYAKMTARHYAARGYGEGRVRDELYRRGVPKDFWDDALAEMETPDEKIDKLVASKLRGADDEKTVQKAAAMLLRRGFKWEQVRSALERYRISIEESEYDI